VTAYQPIYFFEGTGGTIKNSRIHRSGPGVTHSLNLGYINGITFENCEFGNLSRILSSGQAFHMVQSENITLNNCRLFGPLLLFSNVNKLRVNNLDTISRYNGKTNNFYNTYAAYASLCNDVIYDGITFGYNGLVPDVGPFLCLVVHSATNKFRVRNCGTKANPLVPTTFRMNYYGLTSICNNSGYNNDFKVQNVYVDKVRSTPFLHPNTDRNIRMEKVYCGDYLYWQYANQGNLIYAINSQLKGCRVGRRGVSNIAAVYGTHFNDYFLGDTMGEIVLGFNEPTEVTASQYTKVAGNPRFNSSTGLLMTSVGDEIIMEDAIFRKGHTGFVNATPLLSAAVAANYNLEYDIDLGDGYSGTWTALTGANLSAITIDPDIGFKIKIHITTTSANIHAMSYLSILTTSSESAQAFEYPSEEYTLTISGLETGTKVAFLETGTETLLQDVATEVGGKVSYKFPDTIAGNIIDIKILCADYAPQTIKYTVTEADAEIPVSLQEDLGYDPLRTADVIFDASAKRIDMGAGVTDLDVQGLYRQWVDWAVTDDNLKYKQAMYSVGGNEIDSGAGTSIPVYVYLINGWQIKPDEANHKLVVDEGVVLTEDGSNSFANTVGAFTVQISFQQPVSAIGVTNQSLLASAVWDASMASHTTAGTAGEKVGKKLLDKGTFIALG
jgi:hypothetical protein